MLLALVVLGAPSARAEEVGERLIVLVDPVDGIDSAERLGSGLAVRTIGFALAQALSPRLEIVLARGDYSSPAEPFPWIVPDHLRELVLRAAMTGEPRPRILLAPEIGPLLEVERVGADALPFELRLANVEVSGARTAIQAVIADLATAKIELVESRFESLGRAAIDAVARGSASLEVTIRRSSSIACGAAAILESLDDATTHLLLEESELRGLRGYGPEGFLGGAIELHGAGGGRIDARIARATFADTANAIVLSSAGSGANLDVVLLNSLVFTSADRACGGSEIACGVEHVVYGALYEPEHASLRFVHNTFWGVRRAIVAIENPLGLAQDDFASLWEGNIVLGDEERPAGTWMADLDLSSDDLRGDVGLRSNLVPPAWLPEIIAVDLGENSTPGDDPFADLAQDDFRLRPESEAIDRRLSDAVLAAELGPFDLAGSCRLSGPADGRSAQELAFDLGAYELEIEGGCALGAFLRGDCNGSATVDISDAIYGFAYLFLGGPGPFCMDACDANDDGAVDISDGIGILSYLFASGPAIPPPYPHDGADPTPDSLPACPWQVGE